MMISYFFFHLLDVFPLSASLSTGKSEECLTNGHVLCRLGFLDFPSYSPFSFVFE